ncbi:hypothetical protein EGM70_11305 [Enterobacteriaceae bacterium 89]|nr:hypothetical protein [Enterobacteriaceae bacterium 89]
MMKKTVFGVVLSLLSWNTPFAKTITITAEFTPSVTSPGNDKFTNTTSSYGYCSTFPANCDNNGWFSVALGINANPIEELLAGEKVEFGMPAASRDIIVTNKLTGTQRVVTFAVNGFGGRNRGYGGQSTGVNSNWNSSWIYPSSGCSSSGYSMGDNNVYSRFWRWPNRNDSTLCSKTTNVDRGSYPSLDMTNFMYLLTTPNPLEMDEDVYEGQISFSVAGSGAEISLGGAKYQTTDDQLIINFELTVTHEMNVRPLETGTVNLHACQTGKICTAAENKINWDKSIITNIPPVLTAESQFEITSSGSFTTYLNCEVNAGDQCGIRSAKTGDIVPVKTLLSLPGNIQTSSKSPVRNMLMKNVRDTDYALFTTVDFSANTKGKFHFEVDKQDVIQMKKNAPDEYSGVITVVFDPQVW